MLRYLYTLARDPPISNRVLKCTLRQHRGDEPEPDGWGDRRPTNLREISVPYELVTLWSSGADARTGVERLAGSVSEALVGATPEEGNGADAGSGRVRSGLGELVLRA